MHPFARAVVSSILFCVVGSVAFSNQPAPIGGAGGSGTGKGNGAANCNCGTTPATGQSIPHSSSVNVSVSLTGGGTANAGSQSTGQSGSAATGQTIPPGKCRFVRYTFDCEQVAGQWECVLRSFTTSDRDTTPGDCD